MTCQQVDNTPAPKHRSNCKCSSSSDRLRPPSHPSIRACTRAMRESAKQGFWNGSTPPLGYRVVEAERRGAKIKKRLEIDPVEAECVRLIYRLYTEGGGSSGPLGVKETTSWLNRHGYRTRLGAHFGVGPLHRILKNACYATGKWRYGIRNSRTGTLHDLASVVEIDVPTILSLELYERVQRQLASNSPRVTAPRIVNGRCWPGSPSVPPAAPA